MKRGLIREKKAQFYIIAALVIAALVIGFVSLRNYSIKGGEESAVYDLGKELGIESGEVIDFGVATGADINEKVSEFAEDYVTYSQGKIEKERWYFVYSDGVGKPNIIVFDDELIGNVEGGVGGVNMQTLQNMHVNRGQRELEDEDIDNEGNRVYKFKIKDEDEKEIKLNQGQSFYFLIREKIGDEEHVVEGKN